jgi:hypothetical protein
MLDQSVETGEYAVLIDKRDIFIPLFGKEGTKGR